MNVWVATAAVALLPLALSAQVAPPIEGEGDAASPQVTLVVSPVLLVDLDALFAGSLFGQRLTTQYEADLAIVAAENSALEQELESQEMDLAERRPDMDVDDFRAEAEAFDARVQTIRDGQDAQLATVEQTQVEGRAEFDRLIEPVLGRILIERGAAVILYKDAAYLGLRSIDITEDGIAAFDAIVAADPEQQ